MKPEELSGRFFLTPAHSCSYLSDRQAQTLFLDPRELITTDAYTRLTEQGFRRSGAHLYRPHCEDCQACIPTRIPTGSFRPNRAQRRTAKRNRDLRFELSEGRYEPEVFALYERYIAGRHRDGDMFPASPDQFQTFLLSNWSETVFLSAYLGDERVAVAVMDRLNHALSAIYTFFDPDLPERSLGRMMILKQIQLCADIGLPHLYLGYWIRQSIKMRYKTDYRPVEVFVKGRWVPLLSS